MPIDPNDHLQTHDPLGREFTTPEPGGPVAGKLNLVVGEAKNDQTIISLIRDEHGIDLYVGGYDDEGQPNQLEEGEIGEILKPLIDRMEPYAASMAYYSWFDAYVGDISFDEGLGEVMRLLDAAGEEYETV